jgi:DNA-binding Lrp family transcriptional regulator
MRIRLKTIAKAISLKNGFFSVKQISEETLIGSKDVQIVLDRLFREGLIERFDLIPNPGEDSPLRGRPKKRVIYQVTNQSEFKKRFGPKMKEGTGADRMWKIIRYRESFTIRDLIVLADVKKENARWFVKMLSKAKYISPFGSVGRSAQWGLIRLRDPGPKRPFLGDVIGRKKA